MFTGPDKCRRQSRGLTLLEVVVGLAILSLMAGAIYAIVAGSVESTAALAIIQRDDRRTEAFLERARTAFAHLPEGATLELRVLEAEPLRQELTFRENRRNDLRQTLANAQSTLAKNSDEIGLVEADIQRITQDLTKAYSEKKEKEAALSGVEQAYFKARNEIHELEN